MKRTPPKSDLPLRLMIHLSLSSLLLPLHHLRLRLRHCIPPYLLPLSLRLSRLLCRPLPSVHLQPGSDRLPRGRFYPNPPTTALYKLVPLRDHDPVYHARFPIVPNKWKVIPSESELLVVSVLSLRMPRPTIVCDLLSRCLLLIPKLLLELLLS